MSHDPPRRSGSPRIRAALWLGFVVAVVPVVLGATTGGERLSQRNIILHGVLSLPLWLSLLVAWRWPRLGAGAYFILGAAYAGGLEPALGIGWSLVLVAPFFIIAWLLTARAGPRTTDTAQSSDP